MSRPDRAVPGREKFVGPLLAGVPVPLDRLTELMSGFDLPLRRFRLFGTQIARLSLAFDAPGKGEVRPVPRLRILGTGTAVLAAFHEPDRYRPSSHLV